MSRSDTSAVAELLVELLTSMWYSELHVLCEKFSNCKPGWIDRWTTTSRIWLVLIFAFYQSLVGTRFLRSSERDYVLLPRLIAFLLAGIKVANW